MSWFQTLSPHRTQVISWWLLGVHLTVPSRPVAAQTGSELVQSPSSFYASRPNSESGNSKSSICSDCSGSSSSCISDNSSNNGRNWDSGGTGNSSGRNGPLTRYVRLRVAHAPGYRERFPHHRLQRKPLVSYPGMHYGTSEAAIW